MNGGRYIVGESLKSDARWWKGIEINECPPHVAIHFIVPDLYGIPIAKVVFLVKRAIDDNTMRTKKHLGIGS
jgi:hypothetical protein